MHVSCCARPPMGKGQWLPVGIDVSDLYTRPFSAKQDWVGYTQEQP